MPKWGRNRLWFAPIPYKHSSFPDIPFGMPDFKLFCFQPLKSMLSLMKKDDSPFFRSESCNEAYWYFVPSPKGCSLPVHLLFLGTDIFENSCLPLHQQMNLRPEYCDSYGASFHTHLWSVPGISATVFFYVQFHARTQFPPVLWHGTTAFLTVLMCGWISSHGIRSWFHRVLRIQPQKKLVLCITGPDFS